MGPTGAEGTETQRWGRATGTALFSTEKGDREDAVAGAPLPPGPCGFGRGGGGGSPALQHPPQPKLGCSKNTPPPGVYSPASGAKAKGHSLYPAPT